MRRTRTKWYHKLFNMTINRALARELLELLTEAADARKADYGPGDAMRDELLEMHKKLLRGTTGKPTKPRKTIAK